MKRSSLARIVILALAFSTVSSAQQPKMPRLPLEKYTLPNGLTVLLSRDTSVRVVGVDLWYHVGSKNELPGRTGFAHLFEHLMFQGSKHVANGQHTKIIEQAGGVMNGSTNNDATNYYEEVPSNYLETALWLESDRMGFLLDSLTQKKLDVQRDVVKNERRQRVDNVAFGVAFEVTNAALYPATNPYSWPIVGSMLDLSAATLDDVVHFFKTYYAPNNATLAIVGDFEPATAKAYVAKYFGPIPAGPAVKRPKISPASLQSEKRIVLEDARASVPRMNIVWPTIGADHEADDKALDVLAYTLTYDRKSRLARLLSYDRQVTSTVSARQSTYENEGQFVIAVQPKGAASLTLIKYLIDSTLTAMATVSPPTRAEVDRFKNTFITDRIRGLDGALTEAEQLLEGQTFYGDPLHYIEEMDRWLAVTPEDVSRVLHKYITNGRVVISLIPKGSLALAADSGKASVNATLAPSTSVAGPAAPRSDSTIIPRGITPETIDRTKMPAVGGDPSPAFPAIQTRKLSNGIPVAFLTDHRTPSVSVGAIVDVDNAEPEGKTGLAQLTTQMLNEGTTSRTAEQIADKRVELGTYASAFGFWALKNNADSALALMADLLRHPAFPDSSFKRLTTSMASLAKRQRDDPNFIASKVMRDVIYGPTHPYSRINSPAQFEAMTLDDVKHFYEKNFRPPNIRLLVSGDVQPDEMVATLNRYFGDWKTGDTARVIPTAPSATAETKIYLYDRPGSPQSVIQFASLGPRRDTPDFYALDLITTIIGGAFSSRLNLNLREQHHFTYGARESVEFRRPPEYGMIRGSTSVETPKTDSAVSELVRELRDIRGTRPVSAAELEFAKSMAMRILPLQLEGFEGRVGAMRRIIGSDYPLDFYETLASGYSRVTPALANEVVRRYVDPDHMAIVIVGDRKLIEPGLRALNVAPVVVVAPLNAATSAP